MVIKEAQTAQAIRASVYLHSKIQPMNNISTKTYTWYTGDWKPINNPVSPYNGVSISAVANYVPPTSPPTSQSFFSLDLTVTDYTYDPNGVSSTLTIYPKGDWASIPVPMNDTVSPPAPNARFTVAGLEPGTLGKIRIETNASGMYVEIQFSYGIPDMTREELGFIMKIDTIYSDQEPAIIVEA